MGATVRSGLDQIERLWPAKLRGAAAGLLVHPASINSRICHAADIVGSLKKLRLKAFFGPQHGIRGETQDNMIEWEGFSDRTTGLPVQSLYGSHRKPTADMLRGIDVLVIDLQDVGARYYTFIWTMAYVMEACHAIGRSVVVLDRPNPLNGNQTEGPVLCPEFASFVGLHPLPIRHGMTIGEMALYFKETFYQGLDLHIIPMKGWKRQMWFDDTALPWVMPSPNMPTLETATVYPGLCLLEGTNVSEGRGTTRPFEIIGAPFVDPDRLAASLTALKLPGVFFRPLSFLPTFQKYAGSLCGGVQLHVTNRGRFKAFLTGAAIIKTIRDLYPAAFRWKQPPYEYEERLLPIDILAGSSRLRERIEAGDGLDLMEQEWRDELSQFKRNVRRRFLLY